MAKHAVITLCVGNLSYWTVTIPIIRNYSSKIGADFYNITHSKVTKENLHHPKLEKFQIYEFLNHYDRILYLDSDMVIHPDCPNLFNLVDANQLGVVCESSPYFNRDQVFEEACRYGGVSYPGHSNDWFNSGMMVISQTHQPLFTWPDKIKSFPARNLDGSIAPPRFRWWDMPYLNSERLRLKFDIHNLGYRYNYLQPLTSLKNISLRPQESFIFHGCGEDKSGLYQMIETWYSYPVSQLFSVRKDP
ncbi:glycosyltransferase [Acaryochloris sp. IP29b_bin.148]|uniref:glycosyltransferase n=1 Tax=Acaryochloris sp. IP29b_bin.148 TaxID=2969218 RepID=UPI002608E255|nr:glycosyltransferase [Acaryochloris sp. IP29b_bin.148]